MTKEEREAFLAHVHVGVISVAEDGHGPLTVPVWYSYETGGEVRIITARRSRKGKLLERAGRFSLCAAQPAASAAELRRAPHRGKGAGGPSVVLAEVVALGDAAVVPPVQTAPLEHRHHQIHELLDRAR